MNLDRLVFDQQAKRREDAVEVKVSGCQVLLPNAKFLPLTALHVDVETSVEGWVLLSNRRFPEGWKEQVALARWLVLVYRQRFSIEDVFAWTKNSLGWESVQVLDFQALRVVVAFSWIAAAFLFELGGELEHNEVLLLAELGGWRHGKKPPGKRAVALGLERLSVFLMMKHAKARQLDALSVRLFGPS